MQAISCTRERFPPMPTIPHLKCRPTTTRRKARPPSRAVVSDFPGITFNMPIPSLTASPPKLALSGTAATALPPTIPLVHQNITCPGKGIVPHWLAVVARQILEDAYILPNGPSSQQSLENTETLPSNIDLSRENSQDTHSNGMSTSSPDLAKSRSIQEACTLPAIAMSRQRELAPICTPLCAIESLPKNSTCDALSGVESQNSLLRPLTALITSEIAAIVPSSILTPPLTPMRTRLRDIVASSVSPAPSDQSTQNIKELDQFDEHHTAKSSNSFPSLSDSSRGISRTASPIENVETPPTSPLLSLCSISSEADVCVKKREDTEDAKCAGQNSKRGRPVSNAPPKKGKQEPSCKAGDDTIPCRKRRRADLSNCKSSVKPRSSSPSKLSSCDASSDVKEVPGGYLSTCYSCQNEYLSEKPLPRSQLGRQSARRAAAITAAAYGAHDVRGLRDSQHASSSAVVSLCPVCSDLYQRHGLRCTACYFVPAENIVDDGQFKCERCCGGTYCGGRM